MLNGTGKTSAIPDSSRLKHIMERRIVGNALRLDPKRPRRDQLDRRLAERAAGARVMDLGPGLLVADDVS